MKHSKLFNQIRKNNEAIAAENRAKLKEMYARHRENVEQKQSADGEVNAQIQAIKQEHIENTKMVKERGVNAETEEK